MGLDFDAAKGSLKISKMQFDQLDELDGNKDGKIEESIFESALKLRDFVNQSYTPNDYKNAIDELVKNFGEAIKDKFDAITQILAKGVTHWESPNNSGMNVKLEPNGNSSIQTDANDKTEVPQGIVELAKNIAKTSMMYKNVDNWGGAYTPIPGCEIINTQTKWIYDNDTYHGVDNDCVSVGPNGSTENYRRPDGVEVKITYFYQGQEHSVVYTEEMDTRYIMQDVERMTPISEENAQAMEEKFGESAPARTPEENIDEPAPVPEEEMDERPLK